ncbi:MAG: amino acid adenylation domain-containing protein [Candidatus Rokubacteria bacterium]|nr:amino acid adenylation domain-containing protein [Candidatus Rokubacteria bacterium]
MTTLVDLVEGGASRTRSGKAAVRAGERGETELTYAGLLAGARGIASMLHRTGIGRGDRVGLWMDKSPASVQAILAILFAGAAYVPLDPRSPWRRCRAICLDCGMSALVADRPHLQALPDLLEGWSPRLLLADAGLEEALSSVARLPAGRPEVRTLDEAAASPVARDLPRPGADDLAYILYTSGSTGTPKGVVHTHRSGVAFTTWILERFGIREDDVFSSHAPFHFDLSISDLYASLGAGATVHLIGATEGMLAAYLVRQVPLWGITVWYSVPSILMAMIDAGGLERTGFGRVRTLFFAGEVFPTPQLRRLRRALPGVGLFNLFGPTETNVCTYYEVPPDLPDDWTAPISIGRACEHMETFVLDDEGRTVGEGVEGTLWARGDNLMQGYWNDAERTAASLRPDPRGRPGTAYCTGDRVVLQADGNYEFRGRRDHMIKVRGHRVELGEVECALVAHPEVLEAVAIPLPDGLAGHRIVAAVVARAGLRPQPGELRAFCAQRLPIYMVPETVEVREAFPRTSTGKADRQALLRGWTAGEGS